MSDLDDFLVRWAQELLIRTAVETRPEIVVLASPHREPPYLEPGSILVAWAYDSDFLNPAMTRLRSGEPLVDVLEGSLSGLDANPAAEDVLEVVPAIGTLTYSGRPLVPIAVIPPAPGAIGATVLTWTGQELESGLLTVTSWTGAAGRPLAFLIVFNPPEHDDDEARLLASLPEDVAQFGVQPMTTPVAAIAATETAAAGAVTRFVATYVAGKAVDAGINAARDYARNNDRQQAADQVRAARALAAQRQAQRVAYRNMSLLPDEALRDAPPPSVVATIDELLALRYQALSDSDDASVD